MDCCCVSKPNPSHNHSAPQISNMRLSFQCFLMTKRHITDHIMERSELFQEHAKKQTLKQAAQCKFQSSLQNIRGKSVIFVVLCVCNNHSKIFNPFQYNKTELYHPHNYVTPRFHCINCKLVAISCLPLNSKLWLSHNKSTVRNTSCNCLTWYKAFECSLGWTWRLSFLLNIQCTIHCIHWVNRYFVVCVYASRVWWLP